jgi:hypothetical protein
MDTSLLVEPGFISNVLKISIPPFESYQKSVRPAKVISLTFVGNNPLSTPEPIISRSFLLFFLGGSDPFA